MSDSGGEAFYIRDEESGHFWTPTPCHVAEQILMYAVMDLATAYSNIQEDGIRSELWIYVATGCRGEIFGIEIKK